MLNDSIPTIVTQDINTFGKIKFINRERGRKEWAGEATGDVTGKVTGGATGNGTGIATGNAT